MAIMFMDHAPNVAATIIILVTISLVVFPLRVYARLKYEAWGRDDWCMTAAFIPFIALSVFCLGSSFQGIGVHKERLSPEQMEKTMMWFFFFEIFFCIAIIPIKLAISLMLIRVAGPKKNYVTAIWIMSAFFITMNAISFFYIIFRCVPVSYAWNQKTPGGYCLPNKDLADIYYADTAVNIVTDWFCALIPIPLIWNLQLNTNAKLSVGFLLSLGILASLSACIRLKYTVNLNKTDDYLYSVSDVLIWGYAENGVGFIVGCVSALRPLFRDVFRLGGAANESTGSRSQHNKLDGEDGMYQPPRYQQDRDGLAYLTKAPQMPPYDGPTGSKTLTAVTGRPMRAGPKKNSMDSETESEEYILQDMSGVDIRRPSGGIQVSRTVHQSYA